MMVSDDIEFQQMVISRKASKSRQKQIDVNHTFRFVSNNKIQEVIASSREGVQLRQRTVSEAIAKCKVS